MCNHRPVQNLVIAAVVMITTEHQRSLLPDAQLATMKRELMNLLERLAVSNNHARRGELRAEALRIADRIRRHSPGNVQERLAE